MFSERPPIYRTAHIYQGEKSYAINSPKMYRYSVGTPRKNIEQRYIEISLPSSLEKDGKLVQIEITVIKKQLLQISKKQK